MEDSTSMSEDAGSTPSFVSWSPGELVWAKSGLSPWWPAQVMDESCIGEGIAAPQEPKNGVLVQLFGIYNYAWVDPVLCLSSFEMNFEERSQVFESNFQRGLKEALEYRDSRRLPSNWGTVVCKEEASHSTIIQASCSTILQATKYRDSRRPSSKWDAVACGKDGAYCKPLTLITQIFLESFFLPVICSGKDSFENTCNEAQQGGPRVGSSRRRKPKVLYEDEERLHSKPKRNLRRRRIMRELGLAAPYGSPFANSVVRMLQ